VLDVRARTITDEMAVAAAEEIARVAEERGLSDDRIVPDMDDEDLYPRCAVATALKAREQGIALLEKTREELYREAAAAVRGAREMTRILMEQGVIAPAPAE